ncbi:MAG: hypothetical protein OXI67_17945 [Candidatus Poribacteria bacterium]|nr:hypothetical protein [Candidatus Poribacteria bacterium]
MRKIFREDTWLGRPYTNYSGSIRDLKKEIPTFTVSDLSIGEGINEFLSVIVREPLDKIDLGDEVDPKNNMRIPVSVVRKVYQGRSHRERKLVLKGYKLIQHHKVLNDILVALKKYITDGKEIESFAANMDLSIYGARMRIEFLVPSYRIPRINGDVTSLKITCLNSVDKSIALIVGLSLNQKGIQDIPFSGFHEPHDQTLEDSAIRDFLNLELKRFVEGKWDTVNVDRQMLEKAVDDTLSKDEAQQIRHILENLDVLRNEEKISHVRKEGTHNQITFSKVRELLGSLIKEGTKVGFRDKQLARFINLINQLYELLDEELVIRK